MVEGLYAAVAQLAMSLAVPKPRIWKSRAQLVGRQWVCAGGGFVGFGCTPSDAYAEWGAKRVMR